MKLTRGFTHTPTFAQSFVGYLKQLVKVPRFSYIKLSRRCEQSSRRGSWCRGFTLIELLVVIAIISILAAILMANFDEARDVSRNKAVRATLSETQLAIELYKSQNGVYPGVPSEGSPCITSSAGYSYSDSSNCSGDFIVGLAPDYIAELPDETDSANTDCRWLYSVANDGSYFKLSAVSCLEGATSPSEGIQADDEFARCPDYCTQSYCTPTHQNFYRSVSVYSLGGECRP